MITKKYRVDPGVPNNVEFPTSISTQFLSAESVGGIIFVCVLIDPEDSVQTHEFLVVGEDAHLDPSRTHKYVGTANTGQQIHHVFRRLP